MSEKKPRRRYQSMNTRTVAERDKILFRPRKKRKKRGVRPKSEPQAGASWIDTWKGKLIFLRLHITNMVDFWHNLRRIDNRTDAETTCRPQELVEEKRHHRETRPVVLGTQFAVALTTF
jgi:hypothetical protein